MPWLFLSGAILAEICATLGLRSIADSHTWWAIALVVLGYLVSFACLAFALQHLKVGVVYAIWSAVGTAAVAVAGARLFGDRLGPRAVIGIVLVVAGVVVLVGSGGSRERPATAQAPLAAADDAGSAAG